jgi:dihydroorotate dehydrogenase
MPHIDLTTQVGSALTLANPFWIASSHYSENIAMLTSWREYEPAAITLKTCTNIDRNEPQKKRLIREKTQLFLPRYGRAYYSDGPKTTELKSYAEVQELLNSAKHVLESTKVGVSVLATDQEQFDDLRLQCDKADFLELNLKYSMRSKVSGESFFDSRSKKWAETLQVVEKFLRTFNDLPVFVKLSRELEWLPLNRESYQLLDLLKSHGKAGIIVANSRKMDVGGFIYQDEEKHLVDGVLSGDPLYDSTLKMIGDLKADCESRELPIVASGGMVDEQQALMAIRAGAIAVQLCTAFDYNGPIFYRTLIAALTNRMKWRGLKNMKQYVEQVRSEGVASVFNVPFGYSSSFWAEEFQKQIQQDVRLSCRMDLLITSGRTLFRKWDELLTERVTTRFRSIRAIHLNPQSRAFAALQETWGFGEESAMQAQRERVQAAKKWLERLYDAGGKELIKRLQKETDLSEALQNTLRAGNTAESLRAIRQENDRRQKDGRAALPCPEWGALFHAQCPFYSMYIFDDKAYVAMYPFIEPGDAASPVYAYPRSSAEYERLEREFERLWRHSQKREDAPERSGVEAARSVEGRPKE